MLFLMNFFGLKPNINSLFKNLYLASWWAYQDLNLGPHPYQGCTLTS